MTFYRLKGKQLLPCRDDLEWVAAMRDVDSRTVARDDVTHDVRVSTVFIGVDFEVEGVRPLLFETRVFGGPMDGQERRYATFEEAEAGHAKLLSKVKAAASIS